MRASGQALGKAILGLAALGGCLVQKMEPAEVCKDVASAIASRTFGCTGDVKLANKRAERFDQTYRCTTDALSNLEELYHCPVSIQALACADVISRGDALDRWLTASPACAMILAPKGAP